ncbi:bucky ball-like [Epinephelus moara]|uniref:bucky ball-like n=1 Tax=Epinephelus moara TaxID=300413 RepID=UPI00214E5A68|nr:bucky ball-like [Epinephelus moara]
MDDGNKQPNTFGSGQQRTQHPRPFFIVQPPSQPFYLNTHWHMNNPYGHFGVPGGFNFGRPCMHPHQYMPFPGFVFPHAPIYPIDYRRVFEPRFHAPAWNDILRHQQHYSQPYGRRETTCSEAQTDPNDAIIKLRECLEKMQATELQGAERELDSGVASQTSGMFSQAEEKKSEEQGDILPSVPDAESPAGIFGVSTTAVYDGESSQRSLDVLSPPGCWSAELEEELPLDSSSVHEECPKLEQPAKDFLPIEEAEVADIQSNISVTDASVPKCDTEELLRQRLNPVLPCFSSSTSPLVLKDAESGDKVSKTEHQKAGTSQTKKKIRKYRQRADSLQMNTPPPTSSMSALTSTTSSTFEMKWNTNFPALSPNISAGPYHWSKSLQPGSNIWRKARKQKSEGCYSS